MKTIRKLYPPTAGLIMFFIVGYVFRNWALAVLSGFLILMSTAFADGWVLPRLRIFMARGDAFYNAAVQLAVRHVNLLDYHARLPVLIVTSKPERVFAAYKPHMSANRPIVRVVAQQHLYNWTVNVITPKDLQSWTPDQAVMVITLDKEKTHAAALAVTKTLHHLHVTRDMVLAWLDSRP